MTPLQTIEPEPIKTPDSITQEPLRMTLGPMKQLSPTTTLCPTIHPVPITVFDPIEVSERIPRDITTFDDIRTFCEIFTKPKCGISVKVPSSFLKVAIPVQPIRDCGPIRTPVPMEAKLETHARRWGNLQ